ncbi:hypothetical protein [Methanolapillus millepedarum]|uniref:Uncharacterized protein n=1 Tax=Methanolapillus millepedarum TaxID=3028296 RepID=A0AA96V441_9EURY|nr:hypothetical protein MsAc7_06970 [Methanosarcinaceae archaeon Ac7]
MSNEIVSPKKTVQLNVRINEKTNYRLKQIAECRGCDATNAVEYAIFETYRALVDDNLIKAPFDNEIDEDLAVRGTKALVSMVKGRGVNGT